MRFSICLVGIHVSNSVSAYVFHFETGSHVIRFDLPRFQLTKYAMILFYRSLVLAIFRMFHMRSHKQSLFTFYVIDRKIPAPKYD